MVVNLGIHERFRIILLKCACDNLHVKEFRILVKFTWNRWYEWRIALSRWLTLFAAMNKSFGFK